MVKAVNGLRDYVVVHVPNETTGIDEKVWIPQVKTIPDIGGTPNQIDATNKESRRYKEYIAGLMDNASIAIIAIPAPRRDGYETDLISIMNKLEENTSYTFEVGMPQLGWKFVGVGQFSLMMPSNTNDDLRETQINIIPSSMSKPIELTVFEVTYDLNGNAGVPPVDPMPYEAGDKATILDGAGITDGTLPFQAWNTVKLGTGTPYTPGQQATITGNLKLYAQVG